MTEQILKYWPMPGATPRKSQIEALEWIEKLPPHIKYILVELPVGAGKSNFGLNFSGWISQSLGSSFVLTPQRILQRQYENSFEPNRLCSVYGKSNYDCEAKKTDCSLGSIIAPKCGEGCPAKMAMRTAAASPNMVLNYTLALLLFKYNPNISSRKLMIFDECHTLETHLTEFNAVTIGEMRCKKVDMSYYSPKSIERALEWLETEYLPKVKKRFVELDRQIDAINDGMEFNPRSPSKDEREVFRNHKNFKEHLESVNVIMGMERQELEERFVLVNEKKSFKFKELYGKNVFHSLVKPKADKFLFMSATILNKDAYCRDLGLNSDEAAFISIPSEFPVDNRPVIYIPQIKMNYEWNSDKNANNRKDLLLKVKEICDLHKDESGIIHTGNFQIAEWLVEGLNGMIDQNILHHNPESNLNRDDVIAEYLEKAPIMPSLLISPSITEGLDLRDDLGRFCIFVKVPFGNLGDEWIKRRKDLSNEWYARQAFINIMQGAGRVTRSKEDYGNTYILDASFGYLYSTMFKYVPHWWRDGYMEA